MPSTSAASTINIDDNILAANHYEHHNALATGLETHTHVVDVAASDVSVAVQNGITSSDVQAALEELQSEIGAATGSTDLDYVASATDGVVSSTTGTNATIPAGSTTNASLMLPGDKTKLNGIPSNASKSDLAYTAGATNGIVTNTGGANATLPVVNGTNAGLMLPGDKTKLDGIETGATADQIASQVPVSPTGNLGSTNVQAALSELQGDIDTLNAQAVDGYIAGAGAPSSVDGVNGNYYLNVTNGDVYGPKAGGAWPGSPVDNVFSQLGLASSVSPAATNGTGAVGAATVAAREDHRHPVQTAANTPSSPGTTGLSATNVDAALAEIVAEKNDVLSVNAIADVSGVSTAGIDVGTLLVTLGDGGTEETTLWFAGANASGTSGWFNIAEGPFVAA